MTCGGKRLRRGRARTFSLWIRPSFQAPCVPLIVPSPARHAGTSLLQMLVALLLLAILATLAWPSFSDVLDRLRAETLRSQLVALLSTARSTAVTRHQHVQACPSSDGSTCGDDWSHGWLLFPAPPPSTPELRPVAWLAEQRTPGPVRAIGNRQRVHFRPDGRTGGNNLSIAICVAGRLHSRVVVSVPGRVRSERPTGSVSCRDD